MPDSMITVDAHQHYWQLQNFVYPWNKEINLPAMNLDYLPPDILPQMQELGMQYSVLIQADNSLGETRWMLDLAQRYPHIAGVVGWADLSDPDVGATLDELVRDCGLAGYPSQVLFSRRRFKQRGARYAGAPAEVARG